MITVVIPTHNRAACLGDALRSVMNQTRPAEQVVVVDDGSTDDTRAVVECFGDRVLYIRQRNAGVSAARNTGIAAARGRWIAFLDSDDEWAPTRLQRLSEAAADDPHIVAHATDTRFFEPDGRTKDLFALRGGEEVAGRDRIDRPLCAVLRGYISTPAMAARRDVCLRAGLFDRRMRLYEDLDFFSRVALLGAWAFCHEPLTHVFRKTRSDASLSHLRVSRPVYGVTQFIRVFERLNEQSGLTLRERNMVRHRLGVHWYELADRLHDAGHVVWARRARRRSIRRGGVRGALRGLLAQTAGGSAVDAWRRLRAWVAPSPVLRRSGEVG